MSCYFVGDVVCVRWLGEEADSLAALRSLYVICIYADGSWAQDGFVKLFRTLVQDAGLVVLACLGDANVRCVPHSPLVAFASSASRRARARRPSSVSTQSFSWESTFLSTARPVCLSPSTTGLTPLLASRRSADDLSHEHRLQDERRDLPHHQETY